MAFDGKYKIFRDPEINTGFGYELIIDNEGAMFYRFNDIPHREGGPAIIGQNEFKNWCILGYSTRFDGPAVIYEDGDEEYWIDDKKISIEEYNENIENEGDETDYSEKDIYHEKLMNKFVECIYCNFKAMSIEEACVHYDHEESIKNNMIPRSIQIMREYLTKHLNNKGEIK